jgi:hypothetical protein
MNLRTWIRNEWDRALAIVAAVIGCLLLFLGWWGVSGTDQNWEQIPYLASDAVGGLFALGIAATLWLSASMRDEWCKLDDLYLLIQNSLPAAPNGAAPDVALEGRAAQFSTADHEAPATRRGSRDRAMSAP